MKVQVRYYSRSGNTKILAEAIAKGVNTKAISIDDSNALINDKTDVLFIGGALYAYGRCFTGSCSGCDHVCRVRIGSRRFHPSAEKG